MLFAVLGAIRGHLAALDAVLAEIDHDGILCILNIGNSVVGYDTPNEVIDRLRVRGITSVQGVLDRYAALFSSKESRLRTKCAEDYDAIAETHARLRSANIEYLLELPRMRRIVLDGLPVALCHGAPSSHHAALKASDPDPLFRRERERVPEARIIVCGHGDAPFARCVDDTLFVSAGAVGRVSPECTGGTYAVVSTESEPWTVTFRGVS
ncbi:MAG TPA: metallophosphoesterase family protein [Candidatus Hydrogenedentes bacterium]|nr:metallophosphoesterase family protein [Candidatus Hydrogenedentota bacterium]HPG67021.1 metallophosphoesterase family protein [Candidatus Hydrogenedentota bacterium]